MYTLIPVEYQRNHSTPLLVQCIFFPFKSVNIETKYIPTYVNSFHCYWTTISCIHLNSFIKIFNWITTHCLVNPSCYIYTLISLLLILTLILLYGTEHRNFFGVSPTFVINFFLVCCEDIFASYRSFINDYKSVSIIRVVYNTTIFFTFIRLRMLLMV